MPDRLVLVGHMTTRARVYLSIAAGRHLITGGLALAAPHMFSSTSFIPIVAAAPLWFWGLVFIGAGLACAGAGVRKSERLARLGLIWSATSTLVIAAGLFIAYFTGDLTSPTGPILWYAIALKDFTVCTDPLRSPFEALAEQMDDSLARADRRRRRA